MAVMVGTEGQTRDCIKQKLLCLEQLYLNPLFDDTLALPAPLDWVAPDSDPLNVLEWAGCGQFGAYGKDPLDGFKLKRLCNFARAPRPQTAHATRSIDAARRSPCGSGRWLPSRRRARRCPRRISRRPASEPRARAVVVACVVRTRAARASRVLALERGRRRPVRERHRVRIVGGPGPGHLGRPRRLSRRALQGEEGTDPRPSPGPRARAAPPTRPRAPPCPRAGQGQEGARHRRRHREDAEDAGLGPRGEAGRRRRG